MNKKYLMFGLPIVLGILLVSAVAIYFATINVTFTVSEALSTETVALDFSGVVGDCVQQTFEVTNNAENDLPIQLMWVQTSNENGVTYEITNMPRTETLTNGINSITIELCYDSESVIGAVSGNVILSRGEGDIIGIAHFTQKDLNTWVPYGITADVTYSITGETFTATGIPEGYTLIYYPNTEGDVFANNIANILVYGVSDFPSLPIEADVGDDYCTNEKNPEGVQCDGAKLWLIPNEKLAGLQSGSWADADSFLFETDLITYTQTA
jgi:uncharacterized protein (UPF0218 family)